MKPPIPGRPIPSRNRFDELVSQLIEGGIKRVPNPIVRAVVEELHDVTKDDIAADLRKNFGPDTEAGKVLDGLTKHGARILRRVRTEYPR
jgi:hypothetical protein